MVVRLAASLAFLGLPVGALRSKTQAQNLTLRDWMASIEKSQSEDPRMWELREPGGADVQARWKPQVESCQPSVQGGCPLSRMLPDKITAVQPGGNTSCLNSDPFQFEVKPGDPKKALIVFEGGGGCWDQASVMKGVCVQTVVPSRGIMGFFNPCKEGTIPNPFLDFTVIYIRYCSGDIHLGKRDPDWQVFSTSKQKKVTATQRGYDNARTTLDWAKANLAQELDSLVVAGTSAGGLASQVWSSLILTEFRYKSASVVMDSYVGVFPEGFEAHVLKAYGVCDLPFFAQKEFAPLRRACSHGTITVLDISATIMKAHPEVTFAHMTSKYDSVQRFFYDLIKSDRALKKVAHDHCNGQLDCDISGVPASLLELPGLTAEHFYVRATEVLSRYSRHPNFRWYLLASDHHGWARITYGDCNLVNGAPLGVPDFGGQRRENEERWVKSLVPGGGEPLPDNVCENIQWRALTGCDPSLSPTLYDPQDRSAAAPAPHPAGLLALALAALAVARL
mmetsp:Transcript_18191/g.57227  ORF Transcript_18191/g.57227 Transcript_18191/m.57227 type:complete len:507 (-) Transcript_18191:26-1546(-)